MQTSARVWPSNAGESDGASFSAASACSNHKDLTGVTSQSLAWGALRTGLVNRLVPRDQLDEQTVGLARAIAVLDPVAVSLTKRSINRALDVSGFREALAANVDLDAIIEGAEVPERREFNRIRAAEGLKAAIAWRDARFREPEAAHRSGDRGTA